MNSSDLMHFSLSPKISNNLLNDSRVIIPIIPIFLKWPSRVIFPIISVHYFGVIQRARCSSHFAIHLSLNGESASTITKPDPSNHCGINLTAINNCPDKVTTLFDASKFDCIVTLSLCFSSLIPSHVSYWSATLFLFAIFLLGRVLQAICHRLVLSCPI